MTSICTTPAVTIGLPFYNNQRFLLGTIRSVLAQTYDNWELIGVDDGSSDESFSIAQSVGDPRIRVIRHAGNEGLAARLNEITALARGEIIVRLDAEDLMHPSRVQRIVEFFEANESADAAFSAVFEIDEHNDIRGWQPVFRRRNLEEVVMRGFNAHPTLAVRSSWARLHPYTQFTRRAEDLDLWCQTFSVTQFGYIEDALYYSRRTSDYSFLKYAGTLRDHTRVVLKHVPFPISREIACRFMLRSGAKLGVHFFATMLKLPLSRLRKMLPVPGAMFDEHANILKGILRSDGSADTSASPVSKPAAVISAR